MAYQIEIHNSIEEISPDAWNHLASNTAFAGYKWQQYCEKVFVDAIPYYLIVRSKEDIAGAAVFWLYHRPRIPDLPRFIERMLQPLFHQQPLLICEIPIAETCGLILPTDQEKKQAVFEEILGEAKNISARVNAMFLVFGYLSETQAANMNWPQGYERVALYPGTALDLEGISEYDSYLSRLKKKQRKNVRRNRAYALKKGSVVHRMRTLELETAIALASNVAARHKGVLRPEIARIFEFSELVESCWLVAENNGRFVGFDLLLGDKDTWKVKITGNDYSAENIYFLLSDEDIRFAIEQNASVLHAGTHLYEVKYRLGYEKLNDGYVRFSSTSRLGKIVRWLINFRFRPPPLSRN